MDREKLFRSLTGVRRFFCKAVAIIALAGVVSFFFSRDIVHILVRTVDIKVYYLSFPEVFLTMIELSMYAGVFFSFPLLAFLVWREFGSISRLKPAQAYVFIFFSILLFYCGSLFCYFVVLPSGITFLLGYGTGHIKAMISVQKFVVFCAAMIFAFGVTFEVPIILLFLNRLGIVKSKTLTKTRRYAILAITIASALITPTPDIYNMMLLGVPTYILFEIGILLMKMNEKKQGGAQNKEQDDAATEAFPR
jgi:sec-independent protein translocase protein TatC